MDANTLDDWVASLLSTHSLRQIARITHVGRVRIRAVRDAPIAGRKLFHRLGAPSKATPEIKQAYRRLPTSPTSMSTSFLVYRSTPSGDLYNEDHGS
jgi:hypothetical protein